MGVCLAVVYTLFRKGLDAIWPPGYEWMNLLGKQMVSFALLIVFVLCFYKALCSITIFLTVSFQALRDISVYIAVILLEKPADLKLMKLEHHKKTLVDVRDYQLQFEDGEKPLFTGLTFHIEHGKRVSVRLPPGWSSPMWTRIHPC